MITIIHGEDIASSRNFFMEQKGKANNSILLSEDTVSLTALAQALDGNSLFETNKKEIFIDNFFSKKASLELTNIIFYLQKQSLNVNITIYESRELSKKQLNIFINASIRNFSLPKSVFLFLDTLRPQNGIKCITLFHNALKTMEKELVFYMLIRQFRLLLAVSDNKKTDQIDEIKRMALWQLSKIQRQAELFSFESLKVNYSKIYDIDLAQKTGSNFLSLEQNIDFLLLSL